jgi:hypothetical protein
MSDSADEPIGADQTLIENTATIREQANLRIGEVTSGDHPVVKDLEGHGVVRDIQDHHLIGNEAMSDEPFGRGQHLVFGAAILHSEVVEIGEFQLGRPHGAIPVPLGNMTFQFSGFG